MHQSNLAGFFTTTIDHAKFDIPNGSTEIFFNNIGSGDAFWEGSARELQCANNTSVPSKPVVLKPCSTFAYGFIGRGRKGFTLDATQTIVELSITF